MIPFQGSSASLNAKGSVEVKVGTASYAWLCCNQLLPNSPCIVGSYRPWCFVRKFQMLLANPPSDYQCDLLYVFRDAFIILYPWRNQHSLMESGNLKECLPTIYFCLEATLPKNKTANARPWKFTGTQQERIVFQPSIFVQGMSASTDPIRYS